MCRQNCLILRENKMLKAIIFVALVLLILSQRTSSKLCDLKRWYKDTKIHLTDIKFNNEQEELIEKIEKKIKNLKFSGSGKVNCDILNDYEEILMTNPSKKPPKSKFLTSKKNKLEKEEPEKTRKAEKKEKLRGRKFENRDDYNDDGVKIKRRFLKQTESEKPKNDNKKDKNKIQSEKDLGNIRKLKSNSKSSEETSKSQEESKNPPKESRNGESEEFDPTESDIDETEIADEPSNSSDGTTEQTDNKKAKENPSVTVKDPVKAQNGIKNDWENRIYQSDISSACTSDRNVCSHLCYYMYENNRCIHQYPETNLNEIKPKISKDAIDDGIVKESTYSEKLKEPPRQMSENDNTLADKVDENIKDNDSKDHSNTNNSNNNNNDDDKNIENEIQNQKLNREEHAEYPVKESKNFDQDNVKEPDELPIKSMNIDNIDALIQQRASEYSSKINNLEILLMKLENKFLTQQINKQNDSSSFTKLELQILKLENELLRLNQSYFILSEENEILKKHHLEQKGKKFAALPDANSTKHTELISQQQVKISQLTKWLTNQTDNLNQLKDKSDALTAQNQALYQIVMNQTALIASIMQKVQDLSDENLSYRKETQDLKTKMNVHETSVKILQKLESMEGTRLAEKVPSKEETKTKRFHYLPDVPDASMNRHLWICKGLSSPQICYHFSVLLSPCPPFSTVHWRKCPMYIAEKTASYFADFLNVYPNGDGDSKSYENKQETTENGKKDEEQKVSQMKRKPSDPLVLTGKQEQNNIADQDNAKNKKEKQKKDEKLSKLEQIKDDPDEKDGDRETILNKKDRHTDDSKDTSVKKVKEVKDYLEETDDDGDGDEEKGRPIRYKAAGLKKPKDCYEMYQKGSLRNGVYKIFLPGLKYYVDVYCDMKNGGWTIIQRRNTGDVDFYRNWHAYKDGFGEMVGEHYLGNDFIHFLTNQGHYSLHIELVNWKKERRQAIYKDFWIDDESNDYMLHIEGYDGDAGDGMSKHNEMKFSTFDVDNDKVVKEFGGSCAKRFHGAGWYFKCYSSNLNGQYYENGVVPSKKFDGVAWKPWTGPNYSLKEVVLKVRPKDVL